MEPIDKIIERVQAGDREAFGDLVTEYQSRLRMFLRVLLYNADRVDDLAQETFVTAYIRIDTYEPGREAFYLWLKGVARKLAANENRRSLTRRSVKTDYFTQLRASGFEAATPLEAAASDWTLVRLRECLTRLPERMRGVFREFYFQDKGAGEIAAALNRSVSAVKMTLLRGRLLLKDCLQREGT